MITRHQSDLHSVPSNYFRTFKAPFRLMSLIFTPAYVWNTFQFIGSTLPLNDVITWSDQKGILTPSFGRVSSWFQKNPEFRCWCSRQQMLPPFEFSMSEQADLSTTSQCQNVCWEPQKAAGWRCFSRWCIILLSGNCFIHAGFHATICRLLLAQGNFAARTPSYTVIYTGRVGCTQHSSAACYTETK